MTMTSETKTPLEFFTAGNTAVKEGFEKSLAAFNEMNVHSKKNLEALVASMTAAAKGAETVGARAMAFSRKAVEDQVAAAKALTSAKSIQEAVELQTGFAKSALESVVAEVQELSEITSSSVKDALSPINERVTAFVESVQAPR
jgi:phasin family protein